MRRQDRPTKSEPQFRQWCLNSPPAYFSLLPRGSDPWPADSVSREAPREVLGGASESRTRETTTMARLILLLLAFLFLACAVRAMLSDVDGRDPLVIGFIAVAGLCMGLGAISC